MESVQNGASWSFVLSITNFEDRGGPSPLSGPGPGVLDPPGQHAQPPSGRSWRSPENSCPRHHDVSLLLSASPELDHLIQLSSTDTLFRRSPRIPWPTGPPNFASCICVSTGASQTSMEALLRGRVRPRASGVGLRHGISIKLPDAETVCPGPNFRMPPFWELDPNLFSILTVPYMAVPSLQPNRGCRPRLPRLPLSHHQF